MRLHTKRNCTRDNYEKGLKQIFAEYVKSSFNYMISLSQRGSLAILQLQNSFKLCINREWFITDETVQQLKVSTLFL